MDSPLDSLDLVEENIALAMGMLLLVKSKLSRSDKSGFQSIKGRFRRY